MSCIGVVLVCCVVKLCCLLWSSLLLSTLIFFLYGFLVLRGAVLCCVGISLGLDLVLGLCIRFGLVLVLSSLA